MFPGTYAKSTPDKPAIIMSDTGETMTYARLDERSARVARYLHEQGLRRGDSFAILSENSPYYYEAYWAALRSGLYMTAVNHHLKPTEIAYILNDCDAKILITSEAKADLVREIAGEIPAVKQILSFDGDSYDSYAEAIDNTPAIPPEDDRAGRDLQYSSGTTGQPKGVKADLPPWRVHEPGDPVAAAFSKMFDFDADTVYLSPAPLYHTAPLRFGAFVHRLGGTLVIMPKFDPVESLAAIERYRITHSQWVPTMFVRMLKLPAQQRTGYDLSSHRTAIHAAAPCPVEVKQGMIDWWGPIVHEYFAATEANGVTFIGPAEWLRKPGSVGKAGLGILRICDDDGVELPTGEIGVVYFERESVPFTYHKDPEKTRGAQHPDHPQWTTTGDVGYVDEDGYLFLTDRKAFMIISGGVNIYPQEIENALTMHPKVHDIAVIGVPDPEMGEQVKAVVQPAEGVEPSAAVAEELLEFVRSRIAHYKAPKTLDFVDTLPRTPTGKLQKGKLRAQYT